MKYIKTEKEELEFSEAIKEFTKGKIIRSYISEHAYYQDEYDDIYTAQIKYYDKDILKCDFTMIKLDEEVWSSGEIQGKWNVLGSYKEVLGI